MTAGVEEAWDSLSADTAVEPLLDYEGMGAGPGAGWQWTINACDLDDGRRIYTEMKSGNLPEPGIFLIGVTGQPGPHADRLVVEAFRRSESGQFLQEADEVQWEEDED